jgi:hypothetical protein
MTVTAFIERLQRRIWVTALIAVTGGLLGDWYFIYRPTHQVPAAPSPLWWVGISPVVIGAAIVIGLAQGQRCPFCEKSLRGGRATPGTRAPLARCPHCEEDFSQPMPR